MLQGIARKGQKGTFWSETFQNLIVLMVAVTKFLSNCTKKLAGFIIHKMKVKILVGQLCLIVADSLLTEPPGKPKYWKKNNFLQLLKYLPITLLCGKLQTSKKAVEVYTLQFNCPCLPKRSESKINGI